MKLKWRHVRSHDDEDGKTDGRLDHAERRLDELEKRAERVVPWLEGRRQRNHWAQAISEIYREGRAQ